MAQITELSVTATPGKTHAFSPKAASAAPVLTLLPLKSLATDIGEGFSETLPTQGNMLPIDAVTVAPTLTPDGQRGVVFRISANSVIIYVYDSVTDTWIEH